MPDDPGTTKPLLDIVVDYLRARDLPHAVGSSGEVVTFPASTDGYSWNVYVVCRERERQVLVHSVREEDVPSDHLGRVGEYVNRANFGMVLGNLEINLDDGELRFKTSIDVEGDELTDALLEQLVLSNVAIFGRYLPGVDAVISGAEPAAVIAQIEAQ